jgi:hypothetical protein
VGQSNRYICLENCFWSVGAQTNFSSCLKEFVFRRGVDGVEINLPSREKSALKYLKKQQGGHADSIDTELLKNCGSQLVDAPE